MRNPTDGIIYGVRAYLNSLDSLATMAGDYELKYAHRLKGIDVEGMFNMYTMESFIAPRIYPCRGSQDAHDGQ